MTDSVKNLSERLLGLPHGFLSQQGDWSIQFNPAWPGQAFIGVEFWNVMLAVMAAALVIYVYTRDGRSRTVRIALGLMRASLLGLILFLLNRPILTLNKTQTEPSVLAILVDDSGSMRVPDAGTDAAPVSRLDAVKTFLTANHADLLTNLSRNHNLRLYRFDRTAMPLASIEPRAIPVALATEAPTTPATRSFKALAGFTIAAAGCYFAGLLLFGAAGGEGPLRVVGLGFGLLGVGCHVTAIVIRSAIKGADSAPDSVAGVVFSSWTVVTAAIALAAVVVGIGLEAWRRNGFFGVGAGIVGLVAMLALIAAPFALVDNSPRQQQEMRVAAGVDVGPAVTAIDKLGPDGESTQVLPSVLAVEQDLQGQSVAGVVLLTDGRDTPARNSSEGITELKDFGIKIYPVAVGLDKQPKNIEVQNMQVEESAFKGDVLNVKGTVRVTGCEPGHKVTIQLKDKATNALLLDPDGNPAKKEIAFADDKPVQVELQWKTGEPGNKDIVFEAVHQPGELDDNDNTRTAMVSVRDTQINVLYVDGYPRWEYRYLKTEMIRERSVNVSCLLASADAKFIQEGTDRVENDGKKVNMRLTKFPDSLTALQNYDVLIIGDVDPRYFTDNQLQIINQFVQLGRGFEMIAGPRYSPQAYRNTPIEPLLPVSLGRVQLTDPNQPITAGFRPVVTQTGNNTSIFRFEPDKEKNQQYLLHEIPELFWYCRGIAAKPSVGEVLAEHPTDIGPDGHKAPILVAGRFGGRTLFSAVDETWRWRYYTGESNFDKYWVQQIRYLARNSNIDQGHQLNLSTDQQSYELGQQVRLTLRVLDPSLVRQLPDQIVGVQLLDKNNTVVRSETMIRQDGGGQTYLASFTADQVGKFTVKLPPVAAGVGSLSATVDVTLPRLELNDPRVDHVSLSRLASETLGEPLDLSDAAAKLEAIPSARKDKPLINGNPLWDAPVTLVLFMLLIGTEWIVRKLYGMV